MKISFNKFLTFLDETYPNGAIIKIFKEKSHAESFAKGEALLSTIHHFRCLESTDGRGDCKDSLTEPKVICIIKNLSVTRDDALTGLVFCTFLYQKNKLP